MKTYLDLARRFVHRPKYEPHEVYVSSVTDMRLKWPQVLENRFAVVIAPANYGKTTEMREQVKRMRLAGGCAVFVALRKVADRSSFAKALEPTERTAYEAWRAAPTAPLTLFVDSLDEASAAQRDGIADLIGDVATEVGWPSDLIRWVISTRPAVLSTSVREHITGRLVVPYETTIKVAAGKIASAATGSSTTSAGGDCTAEPETLMLFSMTPLESNQAKIYVAGLHPTLDAPAVLRIANERGLAGFTTSPGGLDILANIGLTTSPPDSLTEVFHRVVAAVQEKQRNDARIGAAGGAVPQLLTEAAQKLASASQVCLLPNIELTDDVLAVTGGVLSARKIASGMLTDTILKQLLNTEMFIDVDLNQVKIYPDEIAPFLAAQRLASLIQSPQQARTILEHFSWQASTGEQGVYRQFLPLMGWLATLNSHCREEIIEREPQALAFFGDLRNTRVPIRAAKKALTESIQRLVLQGDRLGRGHFNLTSENYWQAGPSRLEPLLKELFQKYGDHHWARDALLDIATAARSNVLRSFILKEHGNSYTRLIQKAMDLRYILELGQAGDLAGLAQALRADDTISESVVSTLMTHLSWSQLTAKELAVLVDKQFARGRGGFSVGYAFDSGLVDDATDEQLYELCRALVVRLARLRERESQAAWTRGRTTDRYVELVAETLVALLQRPAFSKHVRVAKLCLIMQRTLVDGHLGVSNPSDLRRAIQENAAVRFELLSLNVRRAGTDESKLWQAAFGYESLCELMPGDVVVLNLPELSEVVRKHEEAVAIQRAKHKTASTTTSRDNRLKVSPGVKKELLENLDGLRDGSWTNGIAWVASWLLRTTPKSRYGEVHFDVFEKEAGPEISSAIHDGFSKVWRERLPEFREHEPQTTHHITAAGLQGLHLELDEGNYLPPLTTDEVMRAIQYAAFEINGYPKWFWPLVEAHQDVAGQELAQLVKQASAGSVSLEHAQHLLTSLENAPPAVLAKVAPLAWTFIVQRPSLSDYIVERLLKVALDVTGVTPRAEFEAVALEKMQMAFKGPLPTKEELAQSARAQRKQSAVWAASWLSAYPAAFCKAVAKWQKQSPEDAHAFIYQLASHLGTDNGVMAIRLAKTGNDGVSALAALYEWTLATVRPEEDIERPSGEAYSPGDRDHAERLRDALIPAIAAAQSQLAYDVLEKLHLTATGPRQIYLRSVQFGMREAQFARPPLAQLRYDEFERNFTADVTDITSFAMKVESDLLAVKYDIEHGEYSLRRFFTEVVLKKRPLNSAEGDKEGLALEADFQSLLASELHHHSKGLYSVTVEPHTAESKRRDVLCSRGDTFASIELKMSRRWTLEKYEEALEAQLVGQYMRHRKATTGFLVIVLQEEGRAWNDPKTGKKIDFNALLELLREMALRLESKDPRRYLRVIGIDATKPVNFRVVAKNSPRPSRATVTTNLAKTTRAPAKRAAAAKKVKAILANAGPTPQREAMAAGSTKAGAASEIASAQSSVVRRRN
jgi:hypothetical protein